MPARQEGPTRYEMANLVVGASAPRGEWEIEDVYKRFKFNPPEDFVVTPFDMLVLGVMTGDAGIRRRDSANSERLVKVIEQAFLGMRYPNVAITGIQIDDYFKVLRGDRPGVALTEGRSEANSFNFPDIRDRYNVLHAKYWADGERDKSMIGDFKRDVQRAVAMRVREEMTMDQISQELGGLQNPSLVVDTMVLDLWEAGLEKLLKPELVSSVDDYERDHSGKTIGELRVQFEQGAYLAATRNPGLMRRVNQGVCGLWLGVLEIVPDSFKALDMTYVKGAAEHYIRSGSHKANAYLTRNPRYGSLGRMEVLLGTYVAKMSFGLGYPTFSFVDVVDADMDEMDTIWPTRKELDDILGKGV